MNSDELAERLAEDKLDRAELRRILLSHIEQEDEWRPAMTKKVDELHSLLVGARGARRLLVALLVGLAALAQTWDWIVAHIHIAPK